MQHQILYYSRALLLTTHSAYAQRNTLVCTVLPAAATSVQLSNATLCIVHSAYYYMHCSSVYRYAFTVAHVLRIHSCSVPAFCFFHSAS
jgi:hypothetical protein